MATPQRSTNTKLTPIPNKKNQNFINSLYATSHRTTIALKIPEMGIDGELEIVRPTHAMRELARKYLIAATCKLVTPPEELTAIEDIFSDEKLEERCREKLRIIQRYGLFEQQEKLTEADKQWMLDNEDELNGLGLALVSHQEANEYLFRLIPSIYPEIERPEDLDIRVLIFLAMGVAGIFFAIEG